MKILIVDDQKSNRELLRWILEDSGNICDEAVNGADAVDRFSEFEPDIVLMDVMMPVMDGHEATRLIKQKAGANYIPVIFLTAMSDDQALIKCLDAGGDDFLSKPIDEVVLQAKIKAHSRTQELNHQIKAKNDELTYLHNRLQHEHQMGEHVLSNAMTGNLLNAPSIKHFLSPMSMFNGDIFLVTPKPSGGLYILLGDFTGHGLAASIGAIPVSQVFFAMTKKNFPISDIASSLNSTLMRFLPDTMFCAATVLEINQAGTQAVVWAGGLPDAYLVNPEGGIVRTIESQNMPLGALEEDEFDSEIQLIQLELGQRIVMYTDGIIEGVNDRGEMYGVERLECMLNKSGLPSLVDALVDDFHDFKRGTEQGDDISIVEITSQLLPDFVSKEERSNLIPIPWKIDVTFRKREFVHIVDPIKQLIGMLPRNSIFLQHKDILHTILKELYSNALEHGILGLSSEIKMQEDGFRKYYGKREENLSNMTENHRIRVRMSYDPGVDEKVLKIIFEDSGSGFDFEKVLSATAGEENNYGRGLTLVQALSHTLTVTDQGRCVEVLFLA